MYGFFQFTLPTLEIQAEFWRGWDQIFSPQWANLWVLLLLVVVLVRLWFRPVPAVISMQTAWRCSSKKTILSFTRFLRTSRLSFFETAAKQAVRKKAGLRRPRFETRPACSGSCIGGQSDSCIGDQSDSCGKSVKRVYSHSSGEFSKMPLFACPAAENAHEAGCANLHRLSVLIFFGGILVLLGDYFYCVIHWMKSESVLALAVSMLAGIGAAWLAFLLQIILHEAGHLIAGLLSGFTFSSFRILHWIWISQNGKIVFRHVPAAASLGQCIMKPPACFQSSERYQMYNYGGAAANAFGSLMFGLLFALCRPWSLGSFFCLACLIFGIILFCSNGFADDDAGSFNDASNQKLLDHFPASRYAFWLQMQAAAWNNEGKNASSYPDAWFPEERLCNLETQMSSMVLILYTEKLLALHEPKRAEALLQSLPWRNSAMLESDQQSLEAELLFVKIMLRKRREVASITASERWLALQTRLQGLPVLYRTLYALALFEGDQEQADLAWLAFEQVNSHQSVPARAAQEKALMEWVQKEFVQIDDESAS